MFKKILSRLAVILSVGMFLGACATGPDYSKVNTHRANVEKSKRPMMVLSPELHRDLVDKLDPEWRIDGILVDNKGNLVLWAVHKEKGTCAALIVLPAENYARPIPCDKADEIYEVVCVQNEFCTDNPYIDGTASN